MGDQPFSKAGWLLGNSSNIDLESLGSSVEQLLANGTDTESLEDTAETAFADLEGYAEKPAKSNTLYSKPMEYRDYQLGSVRLTTPPRSVTVHRIRDVQPVGVLRGQSIAARSGQGLVAISLSLEFDSIETTNRELVPLIAELKTNPFTKIKSRDLVEKVTQERLRERDEEVQKAVRAVQQYDQLADQLRRHYAGFLLNKDLLGNPFGTTSWQEALISKINSFISGAERSTTFSIQDDYKNYLPFADGEPAAATKIATNEFRKIILFGPGGSAEREDLFTEKLWESLVEVVNDPEFIEATYNYIEGMARAVEATTKLSKDALERAKREPALKAPETEYVPVAFTRMVVNTVPGSPGKIRADLDFELFHHHFYVNEMLYHSYDFDKGQWTTTEDPADADLLIRWRDSQFLEASNSIAGGSDFGAFARMGSFGRGTNGFVASLNRLNEPVVRKTFDGGPNFINREEPGFIQVMRDSWKYRVCAAIPRERTKHGLVLFYPTNIPQVAGSGDKVNTGGVYNLFVVDDPYEQEGIVQQIRVVWNVNLARQINEFTGLVRHQFAGGQTLEVDFQVALPTGSDGRAASQGHLRKLRQLNDMFNQMEQNRKLLPSDAFMPTTVLVKNPITAMFGAYCFELGDMPIAHDEPGKAVTSFRMVEAIPVLGAGEGGQYSRTGKQGTDTENKSEPFNLQDFLKVVAVAHTGVRDRNPSPQSNFSKFHESTRAVEYLFSKIIPNRQDVHRINPEGGPINAISDLLRRYVKRLILPKLPDTTYWYDEDGFLRRIGDTGPDPDFVIGPNSIIGDNIVDSYITWHMLNWIQWVLPAEALAHKLGVPKGRIRRPAHYRERDDASITAGTFDQIRALTGDLFDDGTTGNNVIGLNSSFIGNELLGELVMTNTIIAVIINFMLHGGSDTDLISEVEVNLSGGSFPNIMKLVLEDLKRQDEFDELVSTDFFELKQRGKLIFENYVVSDTNRSEIAPLVQDALEKSRPYGGPGVLYEELAKRGFPLTDSDIIGTDLGTAVTDYRSTFDTQTFQLYPDMVLPTYRQVLGLNRSDTLSEEDMIRFIPSYNESGVLNPNFEAGDTAPVRSLDDIADPDVYFVRENLDIPNIDDLSPEYELDDETDIVEESSAPADKHGGERAKMKGITSKQQRDIASLGLGSSTQFTDLTLELENSLEPNKRRMLYAFPTYSLEFFLEGTDLPSPYYDTDVPPKSYEARLINILPIIDIGVSEDPVLPNIAEITFVGRRAGLRNEAWQWLAPRKKITNEVFTNDPPKVMEHLKQFSLIDGNPYFITSQVLSQGARVVVRVGYGTDLNNERMLPVKIAGTIGEAALGEVTSMTIQSLGAQLLNPINGSIGGKGFWHPNRVWDGLYTMKAMADIFNLLKPELMGSSRRGLETDLEGLTNSEVRRIAYLAADTRTTGDYIEDLLGGLFRGTDFFGVPAESIFDSVASNFRPELVNVYSAVSAISDWTMSNTNAAGLPAVYWIDMISRLNHGTCWFPHTFGEEVRLFYGRPEQIFKASPIPLDRHAASAILDIYQARSNLASDRSAEALDALKESIRNDDEIAKKYAGISGTEEILSELRARYGVETAARLIKDIMIDTLSGEIADLINQDALSDAGSPAPSSPSPFPALPPPEAEPQVELVTAKQVREAWESNDDAGGLDPRNIVIVTDESGRGWVLGDTMEILSRPSSFSEVFVSNQSFYTAMQVLNTAGPITGENVNDIIDSMRISNPLRGALAQPTVTRGVLRRLRDLLSVAVVDLLPLAANLDDIDPETGPGIYDALESYEIRKGTESTQARQMLRLMRLFGYRRFRNYHFAISGVNLISNGLFASQAKMANAVSFDTMTVGYNVLPYERRTINIDQDTDNLNFGFWSGMRAFMYDFARAVLPDDGEVSADERARALTGFYRDKVYSTLIPNALARGMSKMYDGEITMLGEPWIKPHDVIYTLDLHNGVYGPAMCARVTTTLNASTGLVTKVQPRMFTQSFSSNVLAEHMATQRRFRNLSVALVIGGLGAAPFAFPFGAVVGSVLAIGAASFSAYANVLDDLGRIRMTNFQAGEVLIGAGSREEVKRVMEALITDNVVPSSNLRLLNPLNEQKHLAEKMASLQRPELGVSCFPILRLGTQIPVVAGLKSNGLIDVPQGLGAPIEEFGNQVQQGWESVGMLYNAKIRDFNTGVRMIGRQLRQYFDDKERRRKVLRDAGVVG